MITTAEITSITLDGVPLMVAGVPAFHVGPPAAPASNALTVHTAVTHGTATMQFDSVGDYKRFMRNLKRLTRVKAKPRRIARCKTRDRKYGRPERRRFEAAIARFGAHMRGMMGAICV